MNLRKATGRECLMEINYTEDRGYLTKYRHRENCQFKQETEKGKVMLPDMKRDCCPKGDSSSQRKSG